MFYFIQIQWRMQRLSFQQNKKNHLDLIDDCDIYNALNLKVYRTDCGIGNSY